MRATLFLTAVLSPAALVLSSEATPNLSDVSPRDGEVNDDALADVPRPRPNIFQVLSRATGIICGPLLLAMALAQLGLLIWLTLELRRSAGVPPELAAEVRQLTGNQPDKAIELAAADPTAFAQFLGVGLMHLPMGSADIRRAVDNKLDELRVTWQMRVVFVLLTGLPGPLSGIVVLLFGMFNSFLYYGAFVDPIQARIFLPTICSGSAILLIGSIEAGSAAVGYLLLKTQMNHVLVVARNAADDLLTGLSKATSSSGILE